MRKIMILCLSAMVFGLVACEKEKQKQKAQVYEKKVWRNLDEYPFVNYEIYEFWSKENILTTNAQNKQRLRMDIGIDKAVAEKSDGTFIVVLYNTGVIDFKLNNGEILVRYDFIFNDNYIRFSNMQKYKKDTDIWEKNHIFEQDVDYPYTVRDKQYITINGVEFVPY